MRTIPFFIGVFDTVASLGSYLLSGALAVGAALLILAASFLQSLFLFPFLPTFLWSVAAVAAAAVAGYVATHLKYASDLEGYSFMQTLHLVAPKMEFYDLHLNNSVWYARHAMSIDENRADFARVPWGGSHNKGPARPEEYPDWLQQVWFAGNHSDVGGSYQENEARLSDVSLGWMVHAAKNLPDRKTPDGFGIKVDDRYLKLNPDPLGPQHDEREPGYLGGRFRWTDGPRHVDDEAILHPSVLARFAVNDGVQHYYEQTAYQPPNLKDHSKVKQYYGAQAAAAPTAASPDIIPSYGATTSVEGKGADREGAPTGP